MTEWFDRGTGIYKSPRPPVHIPTDPNLSLVSYLFQNSSSYPNDVALVDADSNETLSFQQLKIQVSKLAHALLRIGVRRNDVVLFLAPNSIHFPICFLAVSAVGAVATTCNPAYTLAEISKQVGDCDPKLVVTVPEISDRIEKLKLPAIFLNPPQFSKSKPADLKFWNYSDLIEASEGVSDLPAGGAGRSDVAALFYSSGTTGVSKGVVLTHGNFIAADTMAAAATGEAEGEKSVVLCFLPMFHIYAMAVAVYGTLRRGSTVVTAAKFAVEDTLRRVEKYRVSHLYVVPPVMVALAKQSVVRYDVSSLRVLMCAAAPLGKIVMEQCAANFPTATIAQSYGMTESCGTISTESIKEHSRRSGSTGKLIPGLEALIISMKTGQHLPPNQKGEIWIRGPSMTQGYFKNPKATKLTIDDQGWVHTGDLGYFDEEAQLYIVDRIKQLIKCNGYQVAPAELEALLLSHPQILEAVVIPYPETKTGQVPIAYVVRSPDSDLTEEDVKKFVAGQVVAYKRPRRVTFVNNIPKLPSGKILKRHLIHRTQSMI